MKLRVPVTIAGLPPGRKVTFMPSTVTVRYSIPIEEYANSPQEDIPFCVYVPVQTASGRILQVWVTVITEITPSGLKCAGFEPTQPPVQSAIFVVLEEEE